MLIGQLSAIETFLFVINMTAEFVKVGLAADPLDAMTTTRKTIVNLFSLRGQVSSGVSHAHWSGHEELIIKTLFTISNVLALLIASLKMYWSTKIH